MGSPKNQSLKLISLFSGCGGFDQGFKDAGFSPEAAYDLDPVAVDHYKSNIGPHAFLTDLRKFSPDLSKRRPAVVLAGPPCQGFSTVGKRDPDDERNALLPLAGELGLRFEPRVMVVENVAGALAGEHAKHWQALEAKLRFANYHTHLLKCNAVDLGMAQTRRRIFLFAWKSKREAAFDLPTIPARRLDEVLSGVELLENNNPLPLLPGSRLYKIAERIGPGQKLSNVRGGPRSVHTWHIPEVFGRTTAAECSLLEATMRLRRSERRRNNGDADPVSIDSLRREIGANADNLISSLLKKGYLRKIGLNIDLKNTFNGKFRRFRWDDVACTVDTRFGDPYLFLHPNEHRPFTVREAARIQGFPDSYKFTGAEKDNFRIIGNAVPPPMAATAAGLVKFLL